MIRLETLKHLSPGLCELAISSVNTLELKEANNSLAFVAHHFQPKFMGVSEMPLAVCPGLKDMSLSEIDRCNHEFRQTGHTDYPFQEIDLSTQLLIMRTFVKSVARWVAIA